jgi:hypothetical protein
MSLALLPETVVTDVHFRDKFWVVHVHLNNVAFLVLLVAVVLLFLFSRFDFSTARQ